MKKQSIKLAHTEKSRRDCRVKDDDQIGCAH
jgi:hypothetical protein